MQPFVLQNVIQAKEDIELTLPSSKIDEWPIRILEHFLQKYPELARYASTIIFNRIEPSKGYAIGSIIVSNENNAIYIPILVKNFQLYPLDLFIHDNMVYYLSTSRAIKILEGTKIFSGLAPLPMQADEGQRATAKGRQVLEKNAYTYTKSQINKLKEKFYKNINDFTRLYHSSQSFRKIADFILNLHIPDTSTDIRKIDMLIPRDIIQIRHTSEPYLYELRLNSSNVWHPIKTYVDGEGLRKFAEKIFVDKERAKRFVEFVTKHHSVTANLSKTAENLTIVPEYELKPVTEPGAYITWLPVRQAFIQGWIYEKIPLDGRPQWVFLTNQYYALTDKEFPFLAITKTQIKAPTPSKITPGTLGFIIVGKKAIGPLLITMYRTDGNKVTFYAKIPPSGKSITINYSCGTNLIIDFNDSPKPCSTSIIINSETETPYFVEVKDAIDIPVSTDPISVRPTIIKIANPTDKPVVTIRKSGSYYSIEGLPRFLESKPLSDIGEPISFDTKALSRDDLLFILSTKYYPEDVNKLIAHIDKNGSATIQGFRLPINMKEVKTSSKTKASKIMEKFAAFDVPWELIKIAAELDDYETLDSLFALNLANPENFAALIQDIPLFELTMQRLARLLLLTRLGVLQLNQSDLKTLLIGLNTLLEYLNELRFQIGEIIAEQPPMA